jgi:hypothetical protein
MHSPPHVGCHHEQGFRAASVTPDLADSSWQQAQRCAKSGTITDVSEALTVRGAFLSVSTTTRMRRLPWTCSRLRLGRNTPTLLLRSAQVARVAASRTKGVNKLNFAAWRFWTHAARVPGVDNGAQ